MILLIDLGNTRLKWSWLADGQLQDGGGVVHRGRNLSVDLEHAWARLPEPEAVHVASVAPAPLREELATWLKANWLCPVQWATSQTSAGVVHSSYRQPQQLGVDRWLALIGAWRRVAGAACVVDCGSAITVDILDSQGQHRGGLIAPGLHMMRDALRHDTALPMVSGGMIDSLGTDTQAAIQAGTSLALLGLIDRALRHAPAGACLLLTGGDAQQVASVIAAPYELCPDLVLEGLAGTLNGV
jgi:type III pantothenate kinase